MIAYFNARPLVGAIVPPCPTSAQGAELPGWMVGRPYRREEEAPAASSAEGYAVGAEHGAEDLFGACS